MLYNKASKLYKKSNKLYKKLTALCDEISRMVVGNALSIVFLNCYLCKNAGFSRACLIYEWLWKIKLVQQLLPQ